MWFSWPVTQMRGNFKFEYMQQLCILIYRLLQIWPLLPITFAFILFDDALGLDVPYLTRAMTKLRYRRKICIPDASIPLGLGRLENVLWFGLCIRPQSGISRQPVMKTTFAAITTSRINVAEINICVGLDQHPGGGYSISADALTVAFLQAISG